MHWRWHAFFFYIRIPSLEYTGYVVLKDGNSLKGRTSVSLWVAEVFLWIVDTRQSTSSWSLPDRRHSGRTGKENCRLDLLWQRNAHEQHLQGVSATVRIEQRQKCPFDSFWQSASLKHTTPTTLKCGVRFWFVLTTGYSWKCMLATSTGLKCNNL